MIDILEGEPKQARACPVALSLNRTLLECTGDATIRAVCGFSDFTINRHGEFLGKVSFPSGVSVWIHEFDLRGVGEPFDYELEIPDANLLMDAELPF